MRKEIDEELEQRARNSANAVLKGLNKIELKEMNGMNTAKDESDLLMSAADMVKLLNQITGYDAEKEKMKDQAIMDEMVSIKGPRPDFINKQSRVEYDAPFLTYYLNKLRKAYEKTLETISDCVISTESFNLLDKASNDFDVFYRLFYFDAADVVQNTDAIGLNDFSMTSPRFDEEVDFHNYKSDFEWILSRLEKNIENFQKNFITGNYAECSDALTSIYFLDYDIWCLLDAQHDEIRKRG